MATVLQVTVDGVTSITSTNSPILGPISTSASVNWSDVTGKPAIIAGGSDAASARAVIGAGTSSLAIGTTALTAKAGNYVPTWAEITGKPTEYTPASHTHVASSITDLTEAVQDIVAGLLVQGANTTLVYNDAANTLTISSTGGGGTGTGSSAWADITGKPAVIAAGVDAAAARAAISAGTSNLAIGTTSTTAKAGNYVPAWSEITNVPTTFAPATHSHAIADITNLQTTLNSLPTVPSGGKQLVGINSSSGTDARPGGASTAYIVVWITTYSTIPSNFISDTDLWFPPGT